jgi:hypothetical protein
MDRATARRWTTIKISTGGIFIVLIFLGVFMLWRMAALRATLEYPESGLFLARAVLLLPTIACFLVAVWCFALTGIMKIARLLCLLFSLSLLSQCTGYFDSSNPYEPLGGYFMLQVEIRTDVAFVGLDTEWYVKGELVDRQENGFLGDTPISGTGVFAFGQCEYVFWGETSVEFVIIATMQEGLRYRFPKFLLDIVYGRVYTYKLIGDEPTSLEILPTGFRAL